MTPKKLKLAFYFPHSSLQPARFAVKLLLTHWNANSLPASSHDLPHASTPGMFYSSSLAKSPRADQVPAGPGSMGGAPQDQAGALQHQRGANFLSGFFSMIAHRWATFGPVPRIRSEVPMASSTMKLHLGQQGDCSYINEKNIVFSRHYLESGKGFSVSITSKWLLLRMHFKMHCQRHIQRAISFQPVLK